MVNDHKILEEKIILLKIKEETLENEIIILQKNFSKFEDKINFIVSQKFIDEKQRLIDLINQLEERADYEKKKMFSDMNEMFQNSEFMIPLKKRMFLIVEQQINVALSNKGLNKLLRSKIEDILKSKYNNMLEEVIDKILTKILKQQEHKLKLTKEICYSIESEINHLSQQEGLSLQTEEIFRDKLQEIYKTVDNKLALENKNGGG